MTSLKTLTLAVAVLLMCSRGTAGTLRQGFSLTDSLDEFTMIYRTMDNLILLPFKINDTLSVNLVLDTSCRTLLLFGGHFERFLHTIPGKTVEFSGMGSGKPARGKVSLGNMLRMGPVRGENIPIVIAANKKPFKSHMKVDGLIGYDILTRFEIEVHPYHQEITFRPAFNRCLPPGFAHIPLNMGNHKPMIASTINFSGEAVASGILIDTGSAFGLLIKSSDKKRFKPTDHASVLGRGLNGAIKGSRTFAKSLVLHRFEIENVAAGITYTPRHDYASIGMAVLKDYAIVINCVQSYLGLRKYVPVVEDAIL